jgi:outer membrane protein assembly factor BamB
MTVASTASAQHMFRGNAAHTGVYEAEGPRSFKGVKWAFKTEGSVVSSPAVAEGVVYVGSDDKRLYAIDAATGREKWHFATGSLVRSSPAVVDGFVYFGSYDATFYALDAASGSVRWKYAVPGERKFEAKGLHGGLPRTQTVPDLWDFFLSSPAVEAGIVYFGCGDGRVYALDAKTGERRWVFTTQDVVHSSPAVSDGMVYVGSWDGFFYALDAVTGRERWRFKTGEDPIDFNQVGVQSSPAVSGGVVFFGCRDGHLYALDAKTGAEKWAFKTKPSWIIASPAVHDGVAYVGNSIPAMFRAIEVATGRQRFELDAKFMIFSSPAIAGGMAYFGSFNGKLYAVDIAAGRFAWEFQTEAGKRNVMGVISKDGAPDWKAAGASNFFEDSYRMGANLFSLGSILSSPAVVNGVIYVGSTDGSLYALE